MDDPKTHPDYISAEEYHKKATRAPVVLHFQPEGFIVLKEPEDLRRWERDLREKVGIQGIELLAGSSATDTITGGVADATDIDREPEE